jgi:hypothetical protein
VHQFTTHHIAIAQWLTTSHCTILQHTTSYHNSLQWICLHHTAPLPHHTTLLKPYHLHCPTPHNIAYKCNDTMSHFFSGSEENQLKGEL